MQTHCTFDYKWLITKEETVFLSCCARDAILTANVRLIGIVEHEKRCGCFRHLDILVFHTICTVPVDFVSYSSFAIVDDIWCNSIVQCTRTFVPFALSNNRMLWRQQIIRSLIHWNLQIIEMNTIYYLVLNTIEYHWFTSVCSGNALNDLLSEYNNNQQLSKWNIKFLPNLKFIGTNYHRRERCVPPNYCPKIKWRSSENVCGCFNVYICLCFSGKQFVLMKTSFQHKSQIGEKSKKKKI